MLSGKQKSYLRSLAHHEKAIFQIGKGGVNDNMLAQLVDALEKKELIKVSILQNCHLDKDEVCEQLESGTKAEVVQVIGFNIVLYKESTKNKQIHLPS